MGLFFVLFQRAHQAAIDARRSARTSRYLGWSVISGLTLGLALAALLAAATQLWALGLWIVAVGLLTLAVVPAMAPWLIRHLLVPRGLVKAAHACGRISAVAGTDPAAFALVAGAWAVVGARTPPSGDAIAWLQARRDRRGHLGDAEVVATAFLLARSDVGGARQLLASVRELVEVHPSVRELAGEWLAVDAAERGAWHELLPSAADLSPASAWPATPLRFFLEGVAARRLGAPGAPHALDLGARWLLSPYRRRTRALLRTSEPPVAGTTAREPAPSALPALVTLDDAVALHVALQLEAPGGPAAAATQRVHQLALCWDRVLSAPATLDWLEQRARQLGAIAGSAERALAEVMEEVATELRANVERQRLPAPPPMGSRFGQLLTAKLRHGRLDELELGFGRWAERVATGTKLPAADEWREFLTMRQAYRDVVSSGGDDLRRLAFPRAFEASNRAAVALWNHREEYVLAHAILCWELEEARLVGDVAAIELAAKNASLKITTRTGRG